MYYLAEKKVRIVMKKPSIQGKKEDFVLRSTSNTEENPTKDVADGNASSGNRLSGSSFSQPQSKKLVPETKGIIICVLYLYTLYAQNNHLSINK